MKSGRSITISTSGYGFQTYAVDGKPVDARYAWFYFVLAKLQLTNT